ncbi:hypothetical protein L1987_70327 [Smallanthus sonchifolius]|uniref:Uncharacterized protein n=1 Tax=Smallanthus sonchifolius TaxID=185202 RepID=A0ACB9APV7_9ASTR|nr:hypothetical protein L1987_70327 [Smallanthus sonchifolius]
MTSPVFPLSAHETVITPNATSVLRTPRFAGKLGSLKGVVFSAKLCEGYCKRFHDFYNRVKVPEFIQQESMEAFRDLVKGRNFQTMEIAVQEALDELLNLNMLTLTNVCFAQSYLSMSTWAAGSFIRQLDPMRRREMIISARDEEEDTRREGGR